MTKHHTYASPHCTMHYVRAFRAWHFTSSSGLHLSALRPWRVPFHAKRTTPLGSHAAAKLLIKEQVTKVSCRLIVLGTFASFPFCFRGLLAPVRPGTAGKTCNVFRGRWGNTGTLAQCLVDTAWNMLPRLFRLIGCCLLWC